MTAIPKHRLRGLHDPVRPLEQAIAEHPTTYLFDEGPRIRPGDITPAFTLGELLGPLQHLKQYGGMPSDTPVFVADDEGEIKEMKVVAVKQFVNHGRPVVQLVVEEV